LHLRPILETDDTGSGQAGPQAARIGQIGVRPPECILCLSHRPRHAMLPRSNSSVGGFHGEIHAGQLQDLPLGAALGDHLALEKQGSGPFFNGAEYSLVDAAYAPFLQRYVFLDRIHKIGQLEKYPRLKAWTEAIMNRPSTHSFPTAEFEAMYRANVKRRNSWVSQFIEPARAAAE